MHYVVVIKPDAFRRPTYIFNAEKTKNKTNSSKLLAIQLTFKCKNGIPNT